ncbi:MAG: hypothetical protein J2P13_06350 [Acidobacteria bacterium]|nr:hypothetical protein [Acidobacteriota bacterium]
MAVLAALAIANPDTSGDQTSSGDASDKDKEEGDDSNGHQSLSDNGSDGNLSREPSFPGPDPSLLGVEVFGELIMDALDGPTVEDELIQKFDLRHRYHVRYWEDAREVLANHTTIKGDEKTGVVSVTVSDHDPYYAQQMAMAYAQSLNALLAQVSTSSARRERIFLEQRLKDIKTALDAVSQQYASFAGKTGAFDVRSQTQAMVEGEARLAAQLATVESELERLEQIYTDNNIRVARLRASVASLRAAVENVTGHQGDAAAPPSGIAGGLPSLRKLALDGVRSAELDRALRIQNVLYKRLTVEYELAKIQEAKEIPIVDVLDAPVLPERQSFPPRGIMTALGSFWSFVLAGVCVISAGRKRREPAEERLSPEIWEQLNSELTRWSARLRRFLGSFGGRRGAARRDRNASDHGGERE